MRIWFLSHTFYPARGGIENYLAEVSRRALSLGHRPAIVCRRHLPGLPEREEWEGVEIIRHPDFPISRLGLLCKPLSYTRALSRWLHSSGLARDGMAICRYPHYQAALGSVPAAAPSIYLPPAVLLTQIALALREEGWKERAFFRLWEKQIRAVERRAIEGARRIVVFSRVMRDQLESAYGVSPARVEINPPGVDTGKFSPGEKNPDLARRWGLDLRVPVVLCVIRLSAEKNLSFLVESTAPLLKSDRCRLLLVGEGPSRARLEAKTREMGLEGKVVFTGRADFPERYYRLADVFVSPSRYEPFGQVLIEAMASGIPVIALKSDPPRISTAAEEIIEDGGSGFVVPEEPVVLRQKLELLLGNKELRLKMGEKGREICLKKFTWEKHLSGLLAPR